MKVVTAQGSVLLKSPECTTALGMKKKLLSRAPGALGPAARAPFCRISHPRKLPRCSLTCPLPLPHILLSGDFSFLFQHPNKQLMPSDWVTSCCCCFFFSITAFVT